MFLRLFYFGVANSFPIFLIIKKTLCYFVFLGIKAFSCFHRVQQAVSNSWNMKVFFTRNYFSAKVDLFRGKPFQCYYYEIVHVRKTLFIEKLEVVQLIRCSKRSLIGSQLILELVQTNISTIQNSDGSEDICSGRKTSYTSETICHYFSWK